MAYPVDPLKTRYWPEIFGEAGYVLTTESGTEIASYSSYGDYIAQLVSLGTDPEATGPGTVRVNSDAGDNLVNSASTARFYMDRHEDLKVTGVESLSLYGYYPDGGGAANLRYRYGLRVTKPTVHEKLLLKMSLTEAEEALNTKFSIQKKINAGILTGQTAQQFTKIYEVAKKFTSLADVNPTVGAEVHPLYGQKAVLLGIAMDEWTTEDQVFVNVTRDGEQVMKMDAYAFIDSVGAGAYTAESNYEIPLHVVATDKLKVWVENTVSIATGFNVRFKYGIAPLTIIEKIRWGIPITDEENATAMEFDLMDSVIAGVT